MTISEGPIPVAAQKRAVEHLRERTKALLLRQHPLPTGSQAAPLELSGPVNVYPQINAASLPSIWKDMPPLKDAEELPRPEQMNPTNGGPLPNHVENMPLSEIFPASELPDASKTPLPALPTTVKATPAPAARPKTPARTTSTFGTLRPSDGPSLGNPVIPATQPAPAIQPIPTTPPAAAAQPLLPLQ